MPIRTRDEPLCEGLCSNPSLEGQINDAYNPGSRRRLPDLLAFARWDTLS